MEDPQERPVRPWPRDAGAWTNFFLILIASTVFAARQGAPGERLALSLGMHSAFFLSAAWLARYLRSVLFRGRPPVGDGLLSLGGAFLGLGALLLMARLWLWPADLDAFTGLSLPLLLGGSFAIWARQSLGSRHSLVLILISLLLGLPGLWMAAEKPGGVDFQTLHFWVPLELFFPGALVLLEAWLQSAWASRGQRFWALLPHVLMAFYAWAFAPGWLKFLATGVLLLSAAPLFLFRSNDGPEGRSVHWMGWEQVVVSAFFCLAWALGPWK